MFNISAVSLTFFSPKPTDFNISPVGINFCKKKGPKLQSQAIFLKISLWLQSRTDFEVKGTETDAKRRGKFATSLFGHFLQ